MERGRRRRGKGEGGWWMDRGKVEGMKDRWSKGEFFCHVLRTSIAYYHHHQLQEHIMGKSV